MTLVVLDVKLKHNRPQQQLGIQCIEKSVDVIDNTREEISHHYKGHDLHIGVVYLPDPCCTALDDRQCCVRGAGFL